RQVQKLYVLQFIWAALGNRYYVVYGFTLGVGVFYPQVYIITAPRARKTITVDYLLHGVRGMFYRSFPSTAFSSVCPTHFRVGFVVFSRVLFTVLCVRFVVFSSVLFTVLCVLFAVLPTVLFQALFIR